jgi:glycine/D-amino acid oxidase-like deaminating enzyme
VTANGGVSYWINDVGRPHPRPPLPGDRAADVCVVGAGYTGLWSAYYLKRARPDLRIAVLEREFAGFGASGRNGGWLLGDLAGSRERYAARHGRPAAVALTRAMFATIDEVVDAAAAEGIDADIVKSGVLRVATNAAQLARLRDLLAADADWGWGRDDVMLLDAAEAEARLRVAGARGMSWSPHCARVHPGKLVRGLAGAVARLGVEIFEGTPVTAIRPRSAGRPAAAATPYGTVEAEYVIRATEGFTAGIAGHRRDWLPMNSSLIVTEPLPDEVWARIGWAGAEALGDLAHYYMYAQRTADGRIALGGRGRPYRYGSRWDAAGRTPEATVAELRRTLGRLFPDAARARIAHAWSGVLGVPRDWCAAVVVDHVTGLGHAGGYTGHGVATANLAGRTLRDLVLRRETELTALPWVGWRVRRWEPEPLRWLGVHLLYRLYRLADAREDRGLPRTSALARAADLIAARLSGGGGRGSGGEGAVEVGGELGGGRAVEQEQRALAAARPGRRHLDRARVGQRHAHRRRLGGPGRDDPDLLGGTDGRQRQRDPDRRRLRGAPHRHHGALVVERRHAGEQRRHVRFRAEPEHEDVERRHRAMIFRPGRGAQRGGVPGGRGLRVVAVRAVRGRHRMDPARIDVDVVEQRRAGPGLVALGMPGRQEPLVAPPDVQVRPVDRVPHGGGGQLGQHRGADATARQHQRRRAPRRLHVDQPGHQPGGDDLGQQLLVAVDHHHRRGHGDPSSPASAACRGPAATAAAGFSPPWSRANRAAISW